MSDVHERLQPALAARARKRGAAAEPKTARLVSILRAAATAIEGTEWRRLIREYLGLVCLQTRSRQASFCIFDPQTGAELLSETVALSAERPAEVCNRKRLDQKCTPNGHVPSPEIQDLVAMAQAVGVSQEQQPLPSAQQGEGTFELKVGGQACGILRVAGAVDHGSSNLVHLIEAGALLAWIIQRQVEQLEKQWQSEELERTKQELQQALQVLEKRQLDVEKINAALHEARAILQQQGEELWREKQTLQRLVEAIPDAIVLEDRQGRVLWCNPASVKLLGLGSAEKAIGKPLMACLPAHFRSSFRRLPNAGEKVLKLRYRNGRPLQLKVCRVDVHAEDGEVEGRLLICRDVTLEKRADQALRRLALYDPLTQLPNRHRFELELQRTSERLRQDPRLRVALLFIDLDRFKRVNDVAGHDAGDELLIEVARRLKTAAQKEFVARWAGDEFVILVRRVISEQSVIELAKQVCEVLNSPFRVGGQEFRVHASVGVLFSRPGEMEPQKWLREADMAMYRAKEAGGNRFVVFKREISTQVQARQKLERELIQGIEGRQFSGFYQPIVSLRDGRVVGFEALLRWRHPVAGLLAPGHFIEVAEETGLVIPLGLGILKDGLEQCKLWNEHVHRWYRVNVNVSVSQLVEMGDRFVREVARCLRQVGLPGGALEIELTETVLIESFEKLARILEKLKRGGVRLAIDDVGSGHTTLGHLRKLPMDTMKVDRSLILEMCNEDVAAGAIVRSIVELGKELGAEIVAEGIETPEQLRHVLLTGFTHAQGYLFARPMPAELVPGFLEDARLRLPKLLQASCPCGSCRWNKYC